MKIIFHVDVNSAFLSWTAVKRLEMGFDNQDIRLIPAAIGGDSTRRKGVIVAVSIPAKKRGVVSGETVLSAMEKCPEIVIHRADFKVYREYSEKFINILRKYAVKLEKLSIDEAYIEVLENENPIELARHIGNEIKERLGFTVNIGISNVKVLSKMASDFEKPDKIHTLYSDEVEKKLWKLPIERLHGCGHSTVKKLEKIGIKTIGEFAALSTELVVSLIGDKQGRYLLNSARGIGSDVLNEDVRVKSYSNETTLERDVTKTGYEKIIIPLLIELSEKVSERLKKDGLVAYTVFVTAKNSEFKRRTKQTKFQIPTDDRELILETAKRLMRELCLGKEALITDVAGIRLVGLGLTDVVSKKFRQLDIFSCSLIK